jgi:ADP-heptose:LPS heptosyltransferase
MSPFKRIRKKIRQSISRFIFNLTDLRAGKSAPIREKTLVIIKNDFIGDYILFRNFLPYIKQSDKYKDYKITLIGNETWRNLAESLDAPYYDEMIWVSFTRLFKDLDYRARTMKIILSQGYEVLFYPVYSGHFLTEQFLISKIKAQKKVKFSEVVNNSSHLFDVSLYSGQENLFEIYRYKEMVEAFLETKIDAFKWRRITSPTYHFKSIPDQPYVVFFPGSNARLKRWDTASFAKVADYLIEQYQFKIVIAGSKKDNKYATRIISAVERKYRNAVIDLTDKTALLDLAELIERADLLITNDSVAIHMAAAVDTAAICVFMGENYGRFAPYPASIYAKGKFICPPEVEHLVKEKKDADGFLALDYNPNINLITPEVVIATADNIINKKKEAVYL